MKTSRPAAATLLVLIGVGGACGGQPDESSVGDVVDPALVTGGAAAPPLVIQGGAPARPVRTTDGKQHLVYELFLTNPTAASVRIAKLEVIDPECRGSPVATFVGDGLARILEVDVGDVASGSVGASGHAGVFVDLALPLAQRPPRRLVHRISLEVGAIKITVPGPVVSVEMTAPPPSVLPRAAAT